MLLLALTTGLSTRCILERGGTYLFICGGDLFTIP